MLQSVDLIADALELYNRTWEAVMVVVSGNCFVNQNLGAEGDIPVLGCASHQFNIAMNTFLEPHSEIVGKVNVETKKLATFKGRICLKKVTSLRPRLKKDNHWTSTYKMLLRYAKLQPELQKLKYCTLTNCGAHNAILTPEEDRTVIEMLSNLKDLHYVALSLQKDSLTLSDVRALFDHTVETNPCTNTHLAPCAAIVSNPLLESGLVKIQSGVALSRAEDEACEVFFDFRPAYN